MSIYHHYNSLIRHFGSRLIDRRGSHDQTWSVCVVCQLDVIWHFGSSYCYDTCNIYDMYYIFLKDQLRTEITCLYDALIATDSVGGLPLPLEICIYTWMCRIYSFWNFKITFTSHCSMLVYSPCTSPKEIIWIYLYLCFWCVYLPWSRYTLYCSICTEKTSDRKFKNIGL